ncbi:aminotransferase class V-fold PLP-dependent enzyme [Ensifer sp. ENS11]|uniref:aminotransferase class V-fold PLP-dependent enzyme n=1 Tax=Ensifer sp. ENS11 TaxID=2769291 RepID=UPI0017810ABB|nr:aminotransferase class V-fold PLP-dependent enzyme [Ensifer sp. ENS11]MBD9490505.1 aminotransferase class V-fold PLP-dependent enzyme [Ensifer sp. ENS11]MDP9633041.1 selenocysteine lyase/cysteine desulfurase [Ensifer adhaerens]
MSVYLNNATTGYPKSTAAVEAYSATLQSVPSDVRHSAEPAIEVARTQIASLLGVDYAHLFFLSDATLALNAVIRGYLCPGDHCVTDNRSHNAVLRTLNGMPGLTWQIARIQNRVEELDLSALDTIDHPKLVCLTHTSNVTGSIYDVAKVITYIRRRFPAAAVLVDASQSVGFCGIDDLHEADFIVFPAHKHLHSLPGAAVLVARRKLAPFILGGTGSNSADMALGGGSTNFVEVGTPNLPAILALKAALQEQHNAGDEIRIRVEHLTEVLWSGLHSIRGIQLLGRSPHDRRSGVVACGLPGSPEADWIPFLRSQNIVARGGLHCAPTIHEEFGLARVGTLRFSISRFTQEDEIRLALEAVEVFSKFILAEKD